MRVTWDWSSYWFEYLLIFVVSGLIFSGVGFMVYQTVGEAPQRARAEEAAWRARCLDKGGSLIPTESAWMKGRGTYYTGWICAKIETIEP